jgi:hypothetical protein
MFLFTRRFLVALCAVSLLWPSVPVPAKPATSPKKKVEPRLVRVVQHGFDHKWMLTPTASFGGMIYKDHAEGYLFAGLAYYPVLRRISPRLAFGTEVAFRHDEIDVIPTLQVGFALLSRRKKRHDFVRALLPYLNLYAILGTRIPRDGRAAAIRLGLGLSSPYGIQLVALLARHGLVVPNLLESWMELDLETGRPAWLVKLGWGV